MNFFFENTQEKTPISLKQTASGMQDFPGSPDLAGLPTGGTHLQPLFLFYKIHFVCVFFLILWKSDDRSCKKWMDEGFKDLLSIFAEGKIQDSKTLGQCLKITFGNMFVVDTPEQISEKLKRLE